MAFMRGRTGLKGGEKRAREEGEGRKSWVKMGRRENRKIRSPRREETDKGREGLDKGGGQRGR